MNFKNYLLNFGPQHPAAHGVLRMVIELNGEMLKTAILIWLITRGTEKLMEHKNYIQAPLLWCLDYVSWWPKSMLQPECRETINDPLKKSVSLSLLFSKSKLYPWLFLEITRILNHLLAVQHMLWISVHWHLLWAFEEREKLMNSMKESRCSNARSLYSTRRGITRYLKDYYMIL